jgi:hypothetical protein
VRGHQNPLRKGVTEHFGKNVPLRIKQQTLRTLAGCQILYVTRQHGVQISDSIRAFQPSKRQIVCINATDCLSRSGALFRKRFVRKPAGEIGSKPCVHHRLFRLVKRLDGREGIAIIR